MVLKRVFDSRRAVFFATFAVLILSGLWVGSMLLRAWVLGPVDNPILTFLEEIGINQYLVAGFLLGLYLGISSLLILDPMKQTQGVFLTSMWFVGVLVFPIIGSTFSNGYTISRIINFIPLHFVIVGGIIGLATGLWVGGIRQVIQEGFDPESIKLKRANKTIGIITLLILAVGFIEAHIRLTYLFSTPGSNLRLSQMFFAFAGTEFEFNPVVPYSLYLVLDIIFAIVFFQSVWLFVGYADQKRVSTVGPKRYGKTHFMVGLYDAVTRNDDTTDETYELSRKHTKILNSGEWLDPTEGDPERLWFSYIHGIVHKRKRTISTFDFPGEIFEYIKHGINSTSQKGTTKKIGRDLLESSDSGDEIDSLNMDGDDTDGNSGDSDGESAETQTKVKETAQEISGQLHNTNFITEVQDSDVVLMIVDMVKLKRTISDDRQLADEIDEQSLSTSWESPNTSNSTGDYSWKTEGISQDTAMDGGDSQMWSSGDTSDQQPWQSENDESETGEELVDDITDIPDIPTHEYKELHSNLDAKTAIVASKADVYKSDVNYDLTPRNYSRYQDFIKSKLHQHSIGDMVDRSELGVYPVFIEGDKEGPVTGQGKTRLSTFGFEELKEVLEK